MKLAKVAVGSFVVVTAACVATAVSAAVSAPLPVTLAAAGVTLASWWGGAHVGNKSGLVPPTQIPLWQQEKELRRRAGQDVGLGSRMYGIELRAQRRYRLRARATIPAVVLGVASAVILFPVGLAVDSAAIGVGGLFGGMFLVAAARGGLESRDVAGYYRNPAAQAELTKRCAAHDQAVRERSGGSLAA